MSLLPTTETEQLNGGGIVAPIVLGRSSLLLAKQTICLSQEEDSLEDNSPAVQRALAQARAKRGPVLLIPRASPDSGAEEDEEPELANDSSEASTSSESDSAGAPAPPWVRLHNIRQACRCAMRQPA